MRRVVIAVSVFIAVSGLGSAGDDGIDLRSWIGKDREELAVGWGEPQNLKKKKKGAEVLVYEVFAGSHITETGTPCLTNVTLGLQEEVHKITFWIGPDGRITKVKPKVLKLKPDPDPPEDGQDSKPPEFRVNHP